MFLFLIASPSIAQKTDWLRTDKKEFEKIFPYFDTINRNSEYYKKKLLSAPEYAIPDTLSVGTWEGWLNDVAQANVEVTLNISQTSPFIKGFLFFVTPSTDTGPDTTGGEVRGVRKDNHYILVWQILHNKDFLLFLEGNSFKIKSYNEIHSFIGNIAAEHEVDDLTKGNFFFRKKQ